MPCRPGLPAAGRGPRKRPGTGARPRPPELARSPHCPGTTVPDGHERAFLSAVAPERRSGHGSLGPRRGRVATGFRFGIQHHRPPRRDEAHTVKQRASPRDGSESRESLEPCQPRPARPRRRPSDRGGRTGWSRAIGRAAFCSGPWGGLRLGRRASIRHSFPDAVWGPVSRGLGVITAGSRAGRAEGTMRSRECSPRPGPRAVRALPRRSKGSRHVRELDRKVGPSSSFLRTPDRPCAHRSCTAQPGRRTTGAQANS